MDIWEKVKKKNSEVMDIISAKLQSNMQNDGRPLVHNAFEDIPEEKVVVAPRSKTKEEMALEECEKILQGILNGDITNLQQKLIQVVIKCDSSLSEANDLSGMYTEVCRKLFAENVDVPIAAINAYLELYTKRFNPAHCEELLNVSEAYFKKKYAEEYQKDEYGTPIGLFKMLNNQLRDKMLDM